MAQHDYVIDNQGSAAARADLNNLFQAIASQNSGATAPATTYANMFWYETDTNVLWKRNEANSAWISLGTVDETNSKFEPNQTFATQAEAEAGTNNTKATTPLRVAQAIAALGSVTTAQVGSAYAGLATLAVGTYIPAWNTSTTTVASGGTIAGSNLRYHSAASAGRNPFETKTGSSTTFPTTATTALTGTWQAMAHGGGRITTGTARSTSYQWPAAIWLRIA